MRALVGRLLLVVAFAATPNLLAAQDGVDGARGPSGTLDLDMVSKTNDRQKLSFGEETATYIKQSIKKVLRMIESAERAKDIILLNCLNEKLSALKGLLKVVEDGNIGVQEALARKNLDQAEHNFRKVVIARNQSEQFTVEADSCIGEVGTSYPGQTRVTWTYEGERDEAPDDLGPDLYWDVTVRPPAVSPYQ